LPEDQFGESLIEKLFDFVMQWCSTAYYLSDARQVVVGNFWTFRQLNRDRRHHRQTVDLQQLPHASCPQNKYYRKQSLGIKRKPTFWQNADEKLYSLSLSLRLCTSLFTVMVDRKKFVGYNVKKLNYDLTKLTQQRRGRNNDILYVLSVLGAR